MPSLDQRVARSRKQGIALLTVLWAVVMISLIATTFLRDIRTQAQLARNGLDVAQARALADAAVHRAVYAVSELAFEDRWRADGRVYRWSFADGVVRISIRDETGKVDLNAAPEALLRGLFLAAGATDESAAALADAVADFRDSDDLRRPNGAEDADYEAADLERGAKDAPFDKVTELRTVIGMTVELYERVAPAVTVYSGLPTIDPLSAPPLALLAVPGADAAEIERFLAERAEAKSEFELESLTISSLDGADDYLSSEDSALVFSVQAEAHGSSGGIFVRDAVVGLGSGDGRPFSIMAWKRGAGPLATPPSIE